MKHQTKILLLVVIITLVMMLPKTLSSTNISFSGTISVNTTWTEVDTVKITGNVTVQQNSTLTIGAGTVINFMGFYTMAVYGRILAIGNSDAMITFTANNQIVGWDQLYLSSINNPDFASILKHCIFEYAQIGETGTVRLDTSTEVTISNCLFRNNTKSPVGTGIYLFNSPVTVENCIFTGNQSNSRGGEIYCRYAGGTIRNCLFYGNSANPETGIEGIYASESNPTIINCTIISDSNPLAYVQDGSHPDFINCILWNSSGTLVKFGGDVNNHPDFYYCDLRGGFEQILIDASTQSHYNGVGVNCIDVNPQFIGSGDNPYDLQHTSLCINAGDPSSTTATTGNFDLAGRNRILNGRIDIGAYEKLIAPDIFVGNCLEFDGIDDTVTGTGVNTSITTFTMEAWVYHNTLPTGAIQRYLTLRPEVAALRYDGSSYGGERSLHFYIKRANGSHWSLRVHNVLVTGKWMHVAGTYDGTSMRLYLNGALIGSSSISAGLYALSGEYIFSHPLEPMDGKVDEARIWNRALSATEIRESMHLALYGTENGLLNYWQFNASEGTILKDIAGGCDGTLNNMSNNAWVPATYPLGLGFADSHIETTQQLYFEDTDLSIDYRVHNSAEVTAVKLETSPNVLPSGVHDVFDSQYWILHRYGTGRFVADLHLYPSEGITDDEDYPQLFRLYHRDTVSDGPWHEITSAKTIDPEYEKVTFTGISKEGQYLICRATAQEDSIKGNALYCDGINDYINVGTSDWISLDDEFTIEVWVKPENPTTRQSIFSTNSANDAGSFQLEIGPILGGEERVGISGVGTWLAYTSNYAIRTGKWNHITYIYDANQTIKHRILVNGVEKTLTIVPGYTISNNYSDKVIGGGTSSGQYFKGWIDEFRMWNTSRTIDQIRENMYLPLGDDTYGLCAHWQFNEDDGLITRDCFAANNGTLINMSNPWVDSSIIYGSGNSFSANEATGLVQFQGTGFSANYDIHSNARLTVTRIFNPDVEEVLEYFTTLDNQYWIINRFGSGNFESGFVFDVQEDLTGYENQPEHIYLYNRHSYSEGDWVLIAAAEAVYPMSGTVIFDIYSTSGQFVIAKGELINLTPPENVQITRNGEFIRISWDAVPGANTYEVYSYSDPYEDDMEDWDLVEDQITSTYIDFPIDEYENCMFFKVVASTREEPEIY